MDADQKGRRITFGDDGSPGAERAWRWLTAQRWPGWSVDVVTVEVPPLSLTAQSTYRPLREVEPELRRMAPPGCGFTAIRHLVTEFDPRLVLGELTDTDLTVIGARGLGLLKSMRLGSTAETLTRCPSSPVVIARGETAVQRVLACVDGSGHSHAAVDVLASLPWVSDTDVTVIGVVEARGDIRVEVAAAEQRLLSAGARTTARVVEPGILALTINPRLSIYHAIDDLQPDLVVLGTKGLTGLTRVLIGSVATGVAHYAQCSVLLARDESDSRVGTTD